MTTEVVHHCLPLEGHIGTIGLIWGLNVSKLTWLQFWATFFSCLYQWSSWHFHQASWYLVQNRWELWFRWWRLQIIGSLCAEVRLTREQQTSYPNVLPEIAQASWVHVYLQATGFNHSVSLTLAPSPVLWGLQLCAKSPSLKVWETSRGVFLTFTRGPCTYSFCLPDDVPAHAVLQCHHGAGVLPGKPISVLVVQGVP